MPSFLDRAQPEIDQFFDRHARRVFRRSELHEIFARKQQEWRLAQETTSSEFLNALVKRAKLQRIEMKFPSRKETRFAWRNAPLAEVLLSLRPDCHFSHFTAMQMHGLTEQDPRTVYVNYEQSPKPIPPGGLSQVGIDRAFRGQPRTAKTIAKVGDYRVCLLNGKNTGYRNVESRTVTWGGDSDSCRVRVTDLERTLIDITVRPFYAGGPDEVLKAYRRAGDRASATRLGVCLENMNYVYPYQQSIGFYMERSGGFMKSGIERFRQRFTFDLDFYLTYGMKETRYDKRWRLHVPAWM